MNKKIDLKLEQCKSFCNDAQIFPAMRMLVQKHNMSTHEASREVAKQTGGNVSANRARMVYKTRTSSKTKSGSNDPPKKKTKAGSNDPPKNKATVKDHPTVGAAIVQAIKEHWTRHPETTEREVVDACIHCYSATRGYFGVAGNYTVSEMVSAGADQTVQEKKRHKENKKEETRIFNLVKKKLASHKK